MSRNPDPAALARPRRARLRGVAPVIGARAKLLRRGPTAAETILWQALRRKALGGARFRRQHPVLNFVLDFYCPERRLAVEVDGGSHTAPAAVEYDRARTEVLQLAGIAVLRVRNEDVLADLPGVLAAIERRLGVRPGAALLH